MVSDGQPQTQEADSIYVTTNAILTQNGIGLLTLCGSYVGSAILAVHCHINVQQTSTASFCFYNIIP